METALPAAVKDGRWRGEFIPRDREGRKCLVEQAIFSRRDAEILDPAILKTPGTKFPAQPFDVGHLAKVVRELLDGC